MFEAPSYMPEVVVHPYRHQEVSSVQAHTTSTEAPSVYTKGKIMEALTSDERVAEHDIKVFVDDRQIVVKGEVFTEEQKRAVNEVIRGIAPDFDFRNQVEVRVLKGPEGSEAIS